MDEVTLLKAVIQSGPLVAFMLWIIWHHIVFASNGTTYRVWLDGTSLGTSTSAQVLPATRNLVYTGYLTGGGNYYTDEAISNVRFVSSDVYG